MYNVGTLYIFNRCNNTFNDNMTGKHSDTDAKQYSRRPVTHTLPLVDS